MTQDAIAWIKANPVQVGAPQGGLCLKNVRTALGVPALYATAYTAWLGAGGRDGANTHYALRAPSGVPYFYSGGSHGFGHIVVTSHYDTRGDLWVWTTDWNGARHWTLVRSKDIVSHWGLKALGWSETLNGVRVYKHVAAA